MPVTASPLCGFRLGVGVQRLLWIIVFVLVLGLQRHHYGTLLHRATPPIEPPPHRTRSWAAQEVKVWCLLWSSFFLVFCPPAQEPRARGPSATPERRSRVLLQKGRGRGGGNIRGRDRRQARRTDGDRGSESETESGIWRQRPKFGGAPEIKCFQCPCAQDPLQISAQKVKQNENVIRAAI